MTTLEKAQAIIAEHKGGKGTVRDLCKLHGLSQPHFYRLRKQLSPRAHKVKTMTAATKRKYIRRTKKVIDIPLAEAPTKIYIIACEVSDLKKVVGQL